QREDSLISIHLILNLIPFLSAAARFADWDSLLAKILVEEPTIALLKLSGVQEDFLFLTICRLPRSDDVSRCLADVVLVCRPVQSFQAGQLFHVLVPSALHHTPGYGGPGHCLGS
ncbi:hypothetical protein CEXT_320951, partial [Caerostris extrusa]